METKLAKDNDRSTECMIGSGLMEEAPARPAVAVGEHAWPESVILGRREDSGVSGCRAPTDG
jgi:hypothetical protein